MVAGEKRRSSDSVYYVRKQSVEISQVLGGGSSRTNIECMTIKSLNSCIYKLYVVVAS